MMPSTFFASSAETTLRSRPDLLGGVVALEVDAALIPTADGWSHTLYRAAPTEPPPLHCGSATLTAIPYHTWANRDPGPMRVWLRR